MVKEEDIKRGDIFRHYKGEKVGVTKVLNNTVYYTDLETGESKSKTYSDFIGKALSGSKRFVFLEHIDI